MSTTITTPTTASAYQAAWTCAPVEPTSRSIARSAITRLATTRIAPSASALRCSAFPCPYGCAVSAGRPATPTAKKVSSAATRSVPECTASETRPRLCEARPAPSLTPIRAVAASTETSAVRRCGLTTASETEAPGDAASARGRHVVEPPDDDILPARVVNDRVARERYPIRRHRVQVD